MDPIKLSILDYDQRIKDKGYKEVTSNFIHETSSPRFHPEGLFSEEIFGQVTSPERLVRNGYIDLHTTVFHPRIYRILKSLKGLYEEIISGKSYAGFNAKLGDFEKASMDDMEADPNTLPWVEVGTGFSFFLKYFPKLNIKPSESIARTDKILLLNKYRNRVTVSKWIVVAAGQREYQEDSRGGGASEEINKLYSSLLRLTRAIPPKSESSPIFDTVRYAIQSKINEIHEYGVNFLDGKSGFVQRKYGYRKLAYATRNVITSPNMAALSPSSPQFHDLFESKVPLFQAAKAFQPLVVFNLKEQFFNNIFNISSNNVSLIDWNTGELVYREVTEAEKNRFLLSDEIVDIVNLYRNNKIRFYPVRAQDVDGKWYKLYMIYDTGKDIWIYRNLEEFKQNLIDQGVVFDEQYIRDFTYADMLYISTYFATQGRNVTITRYPAIEPGSIFPAKVHLVSTKPGRIVNFRSTVGNEIQFPEYPIIGARSVDSTILHPSRLAGLDADFDGDCVASGSKIEIRFTEDFLKKFPDLGVFITYSDQEWHYAELNIEDFVKPGEPEIRNGIKYYTIPKGCEILSFDPNFNSYKCYEPIEKFTDEGMREVVRCYIANGRYIDVTTNESLAVFDNDNGMIKRIKPSNSAGQLVPVLKRKWDTPLSISKDHGFFCQGWFFGSMISDGWVSDETLGYTKMDDSTRCSVESHINALTGLQAYHSIGDATNEEKLGPSHSIIYHNKAAVDFGNSLDMYACEEHSALTKRISPIVLKNASRDFLFGLLCGLIDGDGSLSCIQKVNGPSFDARISTSSKYLVEDLKQVCYILGLRFYITKSKPRNWSEEAYTFGISSVDMYWNLENFKFTNPKNSTIANYWKTRLPGRDSRDIIPLSKAEAEFLKIEAIKRNDAGLYKNVAPSGSHRATRSKLMEYIDVIPTDSKLFGRISATNTIWCPVTDIESKGIQQTWDFEIPTTKTFMINEGILVYDTISVNSVMSKEANDECNAYYDSLGSLIDLNGSLLVNIDTDLINWITFNLTRDPSIQ